MLKWGWDTKKTELVNLTRFGWFEYFEFLFLIITRKFIIDERGRGYNLRKSKNMEAC